MVLVAQIVIFWNVTTSIQQKRALNTKYMRGKNLMRREAQKYSSFADSRLTETRHYAKQVIDHSSCTDGSTVCVLWDKVLYY